MDAKSAVPIIVSVVIPTYNRRDVVPEAIDSALAQDIADMEVLIVDDGSTDGSDEQLRRRYSGDGRVRVLRRVNGGPPAARNTGVAEARGQYLALLDSDDIWLPGYLASQLGVLRSADADLVLANAATQGADGSSQLLFDRPDWELPDSMAAMCAGAWILTSSTVMRLDVAKKLGFDEAFQMCDDTEFMFRFHEAGYRCLGNPDVLALYRALGTSAGAGQLSADREKLMLGVYRVYQHHSRAHPEVMRRGVAFDRQFGELLLRAGKPADAYPHLRRFWRARPLAVSAVWLLLRARLARSAR